MLKIRSEQLKALQRHAWEKMVVRLSKSVADRCSIRVAAGSVGEFLSLVRQGVERAEGYGIEEDEDLERFLVHLLGDGSSFTEDENTPEVQDILTDPDMFGDDKLEELAAYYADREKA